MAILYTFDVCLAAESFAFFALEYCNPQALQRLYSPVGPLLHCGVAIVAQSGLTQIDTLSARVGWDVSLPDLFLP